MASMSKSQTTQGGTIEQGSSTATGSGVGSPISNEAYDVLTALHSKLEGLEAYRKFCRDGNEQLWKEMSESDVKCVERLVGELESLVKNNKFRMGTPGAAGKA
jgi:hypothetical protein